MLLYSLWPGVWVAAVGGDQLGDDVDGDGEHDGGVVLRGDAVQGLEIPGHHTPFYILIYTLKIHKVEKMHKYKRNVACDDVL